MNNVVEGVVAKGAIKLAIVCRQYAEVDKMQVVDMQCNAVSVIDEQQHDSEEERIDTGGGP